MDEKRMVGDYTVLNSMYIGHREIILGENPKAASGERYATVKTLKLFTGESLSVGLAALMMGFL